MLRSPRSALALLFALVILAALWRARPDEPLARRTVEPLTERELAVELDAGPAPVPSPSTRADASRGPASTPVDSAVAESAADGASDRVTARASLELRLVREHDATPVAGVEVGCGAIPAAGKVALERLRTDGGGRVRFELPAGLRVHLQADEDLEREGLRVQIEALEPGEQRHLELALRFPERIAFHGRVVDRESGSALPGALVREWQGLLPGQVVTADGEGRFVVETTGIGRFPLLVEAQGYGSAAVTISAEHQAAERARLVRLERSARLGVRVDGRTRGELRVRSIDAPHPLTGPAGGWVGDLGPDGWCWLDGLVANRPLSVELLADGRVLHRLPRPLSLAPGESRELVLSLESAAVRGRVLRSDRTPAAGTRLWLLPREEPGELDARLFAPHDAEEVAGRATADARGRFAIDGLAAGAYWIGAAAENAAGVDYAPLGSAVWIGADGVSAEVEILLAEGLTIRGSVLDPQGAPTAGVSVMGRSPEIAGLLLAASDAQGRFALGPLAPGEYELVAHAEALAGGTTEALSARAGDEVVLRMRSAGWLRGRIVDPRSGRLLAAEYAILEEGGGHWGSSGDGTFESALPGGAYDVVALAADGRVGLAAVTIVPGGSAESAVEVELVLRPGGRLLVAYEGEARYARLLVRHDGRLVALDGVEAGSRTEVGVPPGRLEVELRDGAELLATRSVEVEAGGEVDVHFGR